MLITHFFFDIVSFLCFISVSGEANSKPEEDNQSDYQALRSHIGTTFGSLIL
jgi:hypothetical protein